MKGLKSGGISSAGRRRRGGVIQLLAILVTGEGIASNSGII